MGTVQQELAAVLLRRLRNRGLISQAIYTAAADAARTADLPPLVGKATNLPKEVLYFESSSDSPTAAGGQEPL